jgi:multicomponent Na+:H+ antiporter subunit F
MGPDVLLYISMLILSAALLVAFVRVLRGPTLPDRVVAVDLIGVSSVGLIVLGAAVTRERTFLDAAVVIALLGFLATIAYARYAEKESQE